MCSKGCVEGKRDIKRWRSIVANTKRKSCCGTKRGQWSAFKAARAAKAYQSEMRKRGCEPYCTKHFKQASLSDWLDQEWQTRSGKPSSITGERLLPKAAIRALTPSQYARTSRVKRHAMSRGVQYSRQPRDIATIVSRFR